MEIAKIENKAKLAVLRDFNVCPTLSTNERQIVKSRVSERVYEVVNGNSTESKNNLWVLIKKSIVQAFKNNGSKFPTGKELTELGEMVSDVLKDYKWIRVDEIPIIFKRGSIGEYGENFGINTRTINHWIKQYNETTKRETMKKQIQFEQEQERKAEEARLQESLKQSHENLKIKFFQKYSEIFAQYQEIKKEKKVKWNNIPDYINEHNVFFDDFYNCGLLNFDNETKLSFWDKAKDLIYGNKLLLRIEKDKGKLLEMAKNKYRDILIKHRVAIWIMNDADIQEVFEANNL